MIQSWQTVLYRINAGILYRLFLLIEQQLSWHGASPVLPFFTDWTASFSDGASPNGLSSLSEQLGGFAIPLFTWLTSRRLFAATFWNFGHTGDRTPDPLCRKPCALVHFATRLLSKLFLLFAFPDCFFRPCRLLSPFLLSLSLRLLIHPATAKKGKC